MKKIQLFLLIVLVSFRGYSQFSITGTITSTNNSLSVAGTSLSLNQSFREVVCDAEGHFMMKNIPSGIYIINFKHVSFKEKKIELNLQSDTVIMIQLEPALKLADEVIISATKVNSKTPVAFSELDKSSIEKTNYGQDVPYLLNQLPSVVTTSDAGNGVGYTGIRIRGSDASRINVTINGIPLNDAESQNVYWVDLPDIASSTENIQVQRGVGTSTNGAGAFGGSINVQTKKIPLMPYAETGFSGGSFQTIKSNISLGSGLINNHWFMEGRLSKITSDGYIDRATSDLKSFYISGGFSGEKTIVRLNIFSGKEITYQSWNGVPEARLQNDIDGMMQYIERNYLSESDASNLLNSGRTYNSFTYENQVDDYQQDHYQVLFSHQFTDKLLLNTALHYTKGKGFYEEYKTGEILADYGLDDIIISNDTISNSDLVRQKWLDNDFYGITYSLNYAINKKQKLILGGAWNKYDGDHYHVLKWMQWASNSNINHHYYDDNAVKTDFNIFAKYSFDISDKINIYIDPQYRIVNYQYTGYIEDGTLKPLKDQLYFFNPKAGIYIDLNSEQSVFASLGIAHKEPSRDDFTDNRYNERPLPEQMTDYELGYNIRGTKYLIQANGYFMSYKNQLVLKGDVNDVGNYTRINVDNSYRLGLELSGEYIISMKIKLMGNVTVSKNKIVEFTDHLDNYDDNSKTSFSYQSVDIAFSPNLTGMGRIEITPLKNLTFGLSGKFVGEQYLDNTQNEMRKMNDYTVFDLLSEYKIPTKLFHELTMGLLINNLFDRKYVSNGYSYGYIYSGSEVHENFYFPQSGINILGRVTIGF